MLDRGRDVVPRRLILALKQLGFLNDFFGGIKHLSNPGSYRVRTRVRQSRKWLTGTHDAFLVSLPNTVHSLPNTDFVK